MKKKIKRIIITLGIVTTVYISSVAFYYFLFGIIMEVDSPSIHVAYLNDTRIALRGCYFSDSAIGFNRYKLRFEDDKAFIKLYGVLVSDIFPSGCFEINKNGRFSDIKQLYLEDRNETLLIYERE